MKKSRWLKPSENLLRYKFHFLIFIFSFLILTRFNIDPDLGWHLAMGREFLEGGAVLGNDRFSWTAADYPWHVSYFLYQILVTYLFNLGHLVAGLFFGLIASLAVLIMMPKKINFWRALVVLLGVSVAISNLGIRPHTISFLLSALLLVLVEKKFLERKIYGFFWFAYFAIWVNFHQGFLIGLLIMASLVLIDLLKLIFAKKRLATGGALSLVAAFGGTLINPFGFGFWQTIIEDSSFTKIWETIAEFQSIALHFPANLLYALSGLIFIHLLYKKFQRLEPTLFLTAAALFCAGFLLAFMVSFWSVIFIYIMARNFYLKLDIGEDWIAKLPVFFSAVAVSLALVLNSSVNLFESIDLDRRLLLDGYPVGAAQFLRERNLTEGLFNDYGWGGFIDWQLPEAKVFIDGRMAGWRSEDGSYILADYLDLSQGKCGALQKYDIKVALVNVKQDTTCFADWQVAYRDEVARVLVK